MTLRTLSDQSLLPLALILLLILLGGCTDAPEGIEPVRNFDGERYMGKWYEIARLDHSFERGMNDVTATYALRDDGGIDVVNRGYLETKSSWKEARGRAYFVEDRDTAYLKVSFFRPIYGAYVVFELERDNYEYAFVSGPGRNYLWLLSRSPKVELAVLEHFVEKAGQLGFDTSKLIYPTHERYPPHAVSLAGNENSTERNMQARHN